jgi:drug/metabolite transporter (DMT)-like permease
MFDTDMRALLLSSEKCAHSMCNPCVAPHLQVRYVARYCDPVMATGYHMILGGLPLLALAVAQEGGEMAGNLAHLTGQLTGTYVAVLSSSAHHTQRLRVPSGMCERVPLNNLQLCCCPAGSDFLLLLYVSLLGSAASYGIFFYEATVRGNLTALSSLTFLTPCFAAGAGYLTLGETLTPLQLAGAGVTLGSVMLINTKQQQAEAKE